MRLSLLALLAANVVPLAGTLWFGWSAAAILVLYWAENAIVGAYTLAKLWTVATREGRPRVSERVGFSLLFAFHYGLFLVGHGVFVALIAGYDVERMFARGTDSPLGLFDGGLAAAAFGLAISHGVSFVTNFWLGGERHRITAAQVFTSPYPRLVVLHVAVIAGAFGVALLGNPVAGVVALVLLKTGLDAHAHAREHRAA